MNDDDRQKLTRRWALPVPGSIGRRRVHSRGGAGKAGPKWVRHCQVHCTSALSAAAVCTAAAAPARRGQNGPVRHCQVHCTQLCQWPLSLYTALQHRCPARRGDLRWDLRWARTRHKGLLVPPLMRSIESRPPMGRDQLKTASRIESRSRAMLICPL